MALDMEPAPALVPASIATAVIIALMFCPSF